MAARQKLMLAALAVVICAFGMPSAGAAPDPIVTQDQPPPTPEPPPAPAAEQTASEPKNIEPVTPNEATSILGKKVRGPDGKDLIGSVIDILIDDQGKPRAAIVDFGGFLGVGSRKIAVDWQLLTFHPADQVSPVVLNLDRSQIQAAPEYKDPTQPAKVVEPAAPENPAPAATPAPPDGSADAPASPDAQNHDH